MHQAALTRLHACALFFALYTGLFICAVGLCAPTAFAIDETDMAVLQERIDETQQAVEDTATAYNDATEAAKTAHAAAEEARAASAQATEHVAQLQQQIEENTAILQRTSVQLEDQRQKSADAMKLQYLLDAEGFNLVEIFVSSTTINEFLTSLKYMDHLQELNSSEIKKYTALQAEYQQVLQANEEAKRQADAEAARAADEKARAEEQEATAAAEEVRAEEALQQAQAAREQAQKEAEEEIERRAAELEAVGTIDNNVNWRLSRDDFVQEWAARIDAYMAGSPMAGTGTAFAEAAWDFGVDPRWSPAIATIESGKGAAVPYYTSNNAWGWFANATQYRIFSSWEEGIRAHVEYLGRFYGYTVTLDHAKVYCPPNAEKWYTLVVNEMRGM